MRLFVALDLGAGIRRSIATYLDGVRGFAPEARWAKAEALHVTLKFIGEQPEGDIPRIQSALSAIRVPPISLSFRGYGFFPTVKAARVFWIGIEASNALPNLAMQIDTALATIGIPREEHAYTPHLTLARSGSAAPRIRHEVQSSARFRHVQTKLSALPLPDFGTMTAHEFFLFQSKLSPGGSQYSKLAAFRLQS